MLMVNKKIVFGVEGWGTGEVAECETELCGTPPHGKKKCHSFQATVITRNCYVQSIPEKVITETLGRKSSMALWCNKRTSSIQQ